MQPSDVRDPTVIRLRGEFDVARTAELRNVMRAHSGDHVLVDASDVAFIDSSGLAVLLDAAVEARAIGGSVRVVEPSQVVRSLLEITGTGDVLGT